MNCGAIIWVVVVAFLLFGNQTHAAEVGCDFTIRSDDPTTCGAGYILGPIVHGDYEKVVALYRQSFGNLFSFVLISSGGDVAEAIKIGRLFRQYLMSVQSPIGYQTADSRFSPRNFVFSGARDNSLNHPEALAQCHSSDCICASACALIWFGAVERIGTVGLHRPTIDDPEFKSLPAAQAMEAYRRAINSMSRYLEEMEAPRDVIDAMTTTDSSEITWVDFINGLEYPPSFAAWIDAICGKFTEQEFNKLSELQAAASNGTTPGDQGMLRDFLMQKYSTHQNCEFEMVVRQVAKLKAP
jgi:hypothetical protein